MASGFPGVLEVNGVVMPPVVDRIERSRFLILREVTEEHIGEAIECHDAGCIVKTTIRRFALAAAPDGKSGLDAVFAEGPRYRILPLKDGFAIGEGRLM